MPDPRTILITGATGKQGGAVAAQLAGAGFSLRAMTRNPDRAAARALAARGVAVVRGDLDDEASIGSALAGVWGAFSVQNTWEAGVEKEEVMRSPCRRPPPSWAGPWAARSSTRRSPWPRFASTARTSP